MTQIDLALAALGLSAANFILTWGVALYMYLANKNKATNERIGSLEAAIDEKLDDHVERIGALEGRVASAPSHQDLAAIHEKINDVAREVSSINGTLGGLSDTLRLILNRITEKGMP